MPINLPHSAHERSADAAVDGLPWGVSCIKARLHTVLGVTEVDELTKPILVYLANQHAANCLEEAVGSFTTIRNRCWSLRAEITPPSSTASFSSCSVLVGPLLPNSHHCITIPLYTSCYWTIGKVLLLEGFGVFRDLLRNSVKYWLRSLRKNPHGGHPRTGPGPTCGQLALALQTNPSRRPISLLHSNSVSCWNFSFFHSGGILRSH